MELRDYLRVVRRRWVIILATTVVVVAAVAAYTFAATPMYASTVRMFVTTQQSDNASDTYLGGQFSQQRVTSYADNAKSRALAGRVIHDLNLDMTPDELADSVSARVVPETVNLELTVTNASPAMAQALAQAYAEGMVDLVQELETPAGEKAAPIKATIVDPATFPSSPVSPQPVRNLALAVLVGLLAGFGLAVLRDLLDTSVKSPEDLEFATSAPILGGISYDASTRQRPLVTSLEPNAPRVEAFRVLRTNLQFVEVDSDAKVFVVTSALPEEGKTTTSVNLAITLAQAGHRTLLVEGDLRRPKAASMLDLDNAVGVTTVLLGRVSLEDAIQQHVDSELHVLSSGAIPPNPAELLQSNAMTDLLKRLREEYDMVVIDAPPQLPVTDAALLAAQADGALLVVRHGKTTRDQVAQSINRLEQVDATPVGVVMNMVPTGRKRSGYGYGYGYGDGYGYDPQEPTGAPQRQRRRLRSRRWRPWRTSRPR